LRKSACVALLLPVTLAAVQHRNAAALPRGQHESNVIVLLPKQPSDPFLLTPNGAAGPARSATERLCGPTTAARPAM